MHCLFLELATLFLLLRLKGSLDNTIPSVHCPLEREAVSVKCKVWYQSLDFCALSSIPLNSKCHLWKEVKSDYVLKITGKENLTVTQLFIYFFCFDISSVVTHSSPWFINLLSAVFCCKCPDWCNPRRTEVHANSVVWVGHIWVTGSHRWLTAPVSNSGGADLCLPFEFL